MAKLSSRRRMLIYRTLYSMARSKVPVYDALVDIQKAHSRNGRRPKAVIAVFAHEVLVRPVSYTHLTLPTIYSV